MIICFSCSEETKALLDGFVGSGDYPDHSAVIAGAVGNLSVIDLEIRSVGSVVIGAPERPSLRAQPGANGAAVAQVTASAAIRASDLPALLRQPAGQQKPASVIPTSSVGLSAKSVPLNEWLFGQFNRFLPAKVTCRALANLMTAGRDMSSLEKIAMEIANAAAVFRNKLASIDQRAGFGRDEARSVAMPVVGEIKSIQRFANQFVGSMNKEHKLLGLPASLNLTGHHPQHEDGITLTEAGWIFGSMSNPLLDESAGVEKFSEAEQEFLLNHIITSVPVEAVAYGVVLRAIAGGIATPDALDEALTSTPDVSKDYGRPFVATQRSGVVSRMADLRLIARAREGTRVSYVLLPRATEFLRSTEST